MDGAALLYRSSLSIRLFSFFSLALTFLLQGVGLMEIVTEPAMSDGREAASFVRQLIYLLKALGVSDGRLAGALSGQGCLFRAVWAGLSLPGCLGREERNCAL